MLRALLISTLIFSLALPAHAGRWRTAKGLTINSDTSSNIGLNSVERERDTVIRIRPSLSASRQGGRGSLRFSYGPSVNYYVGGTQSNRIRHRLRANGNAELIKEIFFLRMSATADQRLIDPAGRSGFDGVSNPDSVTQTFGIRITPDLRLPLVRGDFATIRISPGINYSFTADSADSADGGDGIRRGGRTTRVNIRSGRFFTRMPWSINYRNDVFDLDSDDSWGRASGTIGYRFSRQYQVNFTVGYDSAQIDSGRSDGSGFRWRGTLIWVPTTRTSLSLGFGEAFFGDDWELTLRHRHKHTSITARYYKNIETVTTSILDEQVIRFEDEFGNEILDPITGEELGILVGTPILVDDVFLLERARLSLSRGWGRTNARLSTSYTKRDYDSANLDSEDAILSLNLRRRLAPRTSATLRLAYQDHREDDANRNDFEEYGAQLGFNYALGPRTSVGFRYRYTDRNSSFPEQNFNEGRFNLNLAFRL
jgi:uncharacterized protein (PEP-CTERM system associated)